MGRWANSVGATEWRPTEEAWTKLLMMFVENYGHDHTVEREFVDIDQIDRAVVSTMGSHSGLDLGPLTRLFKKDAPSIPPVALKDFQDGKKLYILDGNHRIAVARKLKIKIIPAYVFRRMMREDGINEDRIMDDES